MISETLIELSKWQTGSTGLLHLFFTPLSLGLSLTIAYMDSVNLLTGKIIYKNGWRFWNRIFAVNFTGWLLSRLILWCQLGLDNTYFSYFGGDVFSLMLAIDAFAALFLAVSLAGPYFFARTGLTIGRHLFISWSLCISLNLSVFWFFFANAWLRHPVSTSFNFLSFRLELLDFSELMNNANALEAIENMALCYFVAAAVMLGISCFLLIKNPQNFFARLNYRFAALLGLGAIATYFMVGNVIVVQDYPMQNRTHFILSGRPPELLLPEIESRIHQGLQAYAALQNLRDEKTDPKLLADFDTRKADLAYAMLLQRWTNHLESVNDKQIKLAALSTLPSHVTAIIWSNTIKRLCLGLFLLYFGVGLFMSFFARGLPTHLLKLGMYLQPFPWLAGLCAWFASQSLMQPWVIAEMLPAFQGISASTANEFWITIPLYAAVFSLLLTITLILFKDAVFKAEQIENQGVSK
jgi:cytochrome bd ubiquinol oxidase subunit I